MQAPEFAGVHTIVQNRCTVCHAEAPAWQGLYGAPKAVALETPEETAIHAKRIYLQSALTDAMPPANKSGMRAEERLAIKEWFETYR
ncbi:MAG: hypothetical protein ACPGSK_04755 [Alphaproteobacteria bacterium]